MKKIFVLGSINMDYTVSVNGIPSVGESKVGYGFTSNQGGKGANQAVACKKLGSESVSLIACVGNDNNGRLLLDSLSHFGIAVRSVSITDKSASGACIILLDDIKKDNMLVVDRGANEHIDPSFVKNFLKENASCGDVFITQLEVNLDSVYAGLETARALGMYTILNPAPVCEFDKNCLKNVNLIVPNETETTLLTNLNVSDGYEKIYEYFNSFGVDEVILTLGGNGSIYIDKNGAIKCEPYKVNVVDTTSAGDTFIGAVAMRKAMGAEVKSSLKFASLCSSVTVSRKGAAISVPTEQEVNEIMKRIDLK